MSNNAAKSTLSSSARSQIAVSSPKVAEGAAESQANSRPEPSGLLGHSVAPLPAEIRRAMIAEAAYYVAEQRGFGGGHDVEDWLLAEKQIDDALSA